MAHLAKGVAGKVVASIAVGASVLAFGAGGAANDVNVSPQIEKNPHASFNETTFALYNSSKGLKDTLVVLDKYASSSIDDRKQAIAAEMQRLQLDALKAQSHLEEVRLEKDPAEKLADKPLEEVRLHTEEVKEQAMWAAIAAVALVVVTKLWEK